jgi:DNA-binding MarR family transcriptional regulator
MVLSTTWSLSGQYFIPHRLMLLSRMIDRETSRDVQAESNITAAEWRALAYICTTGSSNAAEICLAFEVDRAEVSRAVARLVEARLIQRGKARDQSNRLTLTPTDTGKALHERTKAKRREYFEWILQDLGPAERETFDDMLAKIATRVDERRTVASVEPESGHGVSSGLPVG